MKTRSLLVLAFVAAIPFAALSACSDNNTQTDSGPQNGDAGGKDVAQQNDSGPQDAGKDVAADAPDPCTTGLKFDNTLVPGYPNNVPQP